jgi:Protein of unknown function (DUF1236)
MTSVYSGMIGLALGALVGQSAAQVPGSVDAGRGAVAPSSQLQLTPQQRTAIGNAVRAASAKVRVPDNVPATVGAQVPPVTELYFLPDNALASAPEAKGVKYTMARNQVVLVDPTTMRVVEVIP